MSTRTPSLAQVIRDSIEARLAGLHTMLPGKVVKVDVTKGKCDVQPLLKRLAADGSAVDLPVITNCPIGFYRAGKAAVYLPLAVGDQVEIRFCERSIDVWLTKGGTVDPEDARKHSLSDAVVYPGLYDFTQAPAGASPTDLVVVNDQGKLAIKPDGTVTITSGASGTAQMTPAGKFKFQGASDELLAVIALLIDKLKAANQLDPMTGLGPAFDAATISQLDTVKTKLTGLTA